MEIMKSYSALDEIPLGDIRKLEQICKQNDGLKSSLFLDLGMNVSPYLKSLYVLYQDAQLVSVLLLFVPTLMQAEVSAYTHPDFRRRGYFKQLLTAAVEELRRFNISNLLFLCEPSSLPGKSAIASLYAHYAFTEYFLKLDLRGQTAGADPYPEAAANPPLELWEAEREDLPAIAGLSQEIFHKDYSISLVFANKAFASANRIQYLAWLGNEPVGSLTITLEAASAYISGFGVREKFRRRGYGSAVLSMLISDLRTKGIEEVGLEVDSTNTNAFNLYKKCGFKMASATEYYRKPIS